MLTSPPVLVCLVSLVHLVYLVGLVQPNRQDRPERPDSLVENEDAYNGMRHYLPGVVTIHLGSDLKQSNYIPITKGWKYSARFYRPRAEILDGSWKFPEAQAVS